MQDLKRVKRQVRQDGEGDLTSVEEETFETLFADDGPAIPIENGPIKAPGGLRFSTLMENAALPRPTLPTTEAIIQNRELSSAHLKQFALSL